MSFSMLGINDEEETSTAMYVAELSTQQYMPICKTAKKLVKYAENKDCFALDTIELKELINELHRNLRDLGLERRYDKKH